MKNSANNAPKPVSFLQAVRGMKTAASIMAAVWGLGFAAVPILQALPLAVADVVLPSATAIVLVAGAVFTAGLRRSEWTG